MIDREFKGGVMDIQKELTDCNNWILEQDDDFVTGYGQGNYALGLARLAWQAAKAQDVPDGFVLVPKEPTTHQVDYCQTMKFRKGVGRSHKFEDIFVYKAMIEAQEQAND